MSKISAILVLVFLSACAADIESPVIYLSNASSGQVRNIECNWNGNVLSLAKLNPGDSRSQSFYLRNLDKFFGPVYVTWYASSGERMSKNFTLRKSNLPSVDDETTYNYVQLYFDQRDIEVTTSDNADLVGKTRRMEEIMNKYHDEFLRSGVTANMCANNNLNVCQNADNSGLIMMKKKQVDLTPGTY